TEIAKGSRSAGSSPALSTKMRLPKADFTSASAMGERTALRLHVKRTEPGRVFFSDVARVVTASTLDMQYADQCEKAARRIKIKLDLAAEAFLQKLRTFVVQAPTSHVDRFD